MVEGLEQAGAPCVPKFGVGAADVGNGKQIGKAKTYTPQEFYKETVGGPLNGTFIMAMNDPRRPYYKTYEIEYDRHTYDGHNWKYVNLPMEDIAKMITTLSSMMRLIHLDIRKVSLQRNFMAIVIEP